MTAVDSYWSPNGTLDIDGISINGIWDMRMSGRTIEAQNQWLEWCSLNRLNCSDTVRNQFSHLLSNGHTSEEACDILLLDVSFLRLRLDIQKSDRRLVEIKELMELEGLAEKFQILFQSGLNRLHKSDYTGALDYFYRAKKRARDAADYHFAAFNAIICLENIGFDYSFQFTEFRKSFDSERGPWKAVIEPQYSALVARQLYAAGQIQELLAIVEKQQPTGQLLSFLLWLDALPYLNLQFNDSMRNHFTEALTAELGAYHTEFRLRTLKGLLIAEDLQETVRLTDKIERLYLWTWQWLVNPSAAKREKIQQLRNSLTKVKEILLTAEDYAMLRNALDWMALFSDESQDEVATQLNHYRYSKGQIPASLDYERLALGMLHAYRSGNDVIVQDSLSVIRQHHFHGPQNSILCHLIEHFDRGSTTSDSLKALVDSIHTLRVPSRNLVDGISVDLMTCVLIIHKDGREVARTISASLARIACRFNLDKSLTEKELAQLISRDFDADNWHYIDQFIVKANDFFANQLNIHRKGGAYVKTPKSPTILIRANNPHTLSLGSASEDMMLTGTNRPTKEWLTRHEIASLLGVSRATAVRQINVWLSQNTVERRGIGKASKYRLSDAIKRNVMRTRTNRGDLL